MLFQFCKDTASIQRWAISLGLGLVALLASGCGPDGAGDIQVSGTVKFNGAPVPGGQIVFEPDRPDGKSGPAGVAEIIDGHFDTKAEGGRGTTGGPQFARISGISGKAGTPGIKPLFREYRVSIDVGSDTSQQDIEVPAEAAKGLVVGEDP